MKATTLTFILVALASIPARGAEAPPPVRDQIIAATQGLFDALTEGKVDVWQRTLADDAVIVDEFGRKQDKAAVLKDIRPLPAGFSGSIQIRSPLVRLYGDTAVIDFESFEQETVFDQKLVVRYIFSATYVRQEGSWKMVMLSGATLPTPPPALTVKDLRLEDYPGTYRYGPERAWIVGVSDGKLSFRTRADRPATTLEPIAKDVFMDAGDEKNLIIFRRGAGGRVDELIERRKFNDLRMKRENDAGGGRRSVRTRH